MELTFEVIDWKTNTALNGGCSGPGPKPAEDLNFRAYGSTHDVAKDLQQLMMNGRG